LRQYHQLISASLGKEISGWHVIKQLATYPGMTGDCFSTGYEVTKDGAEAFLKAMDLHGAVAKGIDEMNAATTQYLFERDVLKFCGDRRFSEIIRLYEDGEYNLDGINDV
jgi:hypothetical protein